jgi:hypothetical protein
MKIVGVGTTNRRRDSRTRSCPIRIEIEGRVYDSLDWSLGGFLIEGYEGRRRPGEEITVGLSVDAGGRRHEHVARAEIVRLAPQTGTLAARFEALDAHTVDMLEGWLTGRLRRRARNAR